MSEDAKDRFKKVHAALNYVSKIISSAALVLLVFVGIFLVYYLISAQKVKNTPGYEPKISLYTIVSGSMEPNVRVYDVVVDLRVEDPSSIHIGDVITFKSTSSISKDLIVTHRVIDIKNVNGEYEFVTKGDANPTADSDTAKFDNVIGCVAMRFPQLGRIQFFLASRLGWFLVVLLPAMGVIIYDVLKLLKLVGTKNQAQKIEEKPQEQVLTKEQIQEKELQETLEKIKKNNYMERLNNYKAFEASNNPNNSNQSNNNENRN